MFGLSLRRQPLPTALYVSLTSSFNVIQTKRIGEIRGSGRKVRPQKGQGTARAGHSRPPHWRGGAKAHGPRIRDWSYKLNKKFVKLGLRVRMQRPIQCIESLLTVMLVDMKTERSQPPHSHSGEGSTGLYK